MTVFYKNQKGDHFRLKVLSKDPDQIDKILDQMNLIKKATYIPESEFHVSNPMIIALINENGLKVAELTCENPDKKTNVKYATRNIPE